MKETTKRALLRWFHLTLAIPIIGYIYSPFELIPSYAFPTRFIFLPLMLLSGLWMWKGPSVRRFLSRNRARAR